MKTFSIKAAGASINNSTCKILSFGKAYEGQDINNVISFFQKENLSHAVQVEIISNPRKTKSAPNHWAGMLTSSTPEKTVILVKNELEGFKLWINFSALEEIEEEKEEVRKPDAKIWNSKNMVTIPILDKKNSEEKNLRVYSLTEHVKFDLKSQDIRMKTASGWGFVPINKHRLHLTPAQVRIIAEYWGELLKDADGVKLLNACENVALLRKAYTDVQGLWEEKFAVTPKAKEIPEIPLEEQKKAIVAYCDTLAENGDNVSSALDLACKTIEGIEYKRLEAGTMFKFSEKMLVGSYKDKEKRKADYRFKSVQVKQRVYEESQKTIDECQREVAHWKNQVFEVNRVPKEEENLKIAEFLALHKENFKGQRGAILIVNTGNGGFIYTYQNFIEYSELGEGQFGNIFPVFGSFEGKVIKWIGVDD